MVNWHNWPWSKPTAIEASHGNVYGKVSEEQKGNVVTSYGNQEVIRVPHPENMGSYEKWGRDPEARVAMEVLKNIITGVGYYSEMPEEFQPKKEGEEPHKNKVLVDQYAADINLDEDLQEINYRMFHKGFCPVEIYDSGDSQYDLNILPPESFYKYIDKHGKILKYTQERSLNDVISKWEGADLNKIVWFQFGYGSYGMSLLEPIGNLLNARDDMNKDMPKAIHRWAYPQVTIKSKGPKQEIEDAYTNKNPEEAVFLGNCEEGDVTTDVISIDPQARFIPYIELIYYQICEGLHAPLLLYLKNATEASATMMMESVDRLVAGVQRYIKRRVEKYLFEPQTGEPVPRLVWGQRKTGLEDVTPTDIAAIINTKELAGNQIQWILKQYWSSIPEPDWKADAEISKLKSPPQLQPFQNPFQKKQQQQEIPVEKALEALNDINTNLSIIETNFHEGKIPITQACRFAERVIAVHMKKAHPAEWEQKTSEMFQAFVKERLLKVDKPSYRVTVD